MTEVAYPFVDDGEGYPTEDSVREALDMFRLGPLADVQVAFRGQDGSMTELITQCRIERLVEDWPRGFVGQVVGIASQAGQ
jgi:hypothetical protein